MGDNITAGASVGAVAYNALGDDDPVSGKMDNGGDLFVNDDLEVIDDLDVIGDFYIGTDAAVSTIFFQDSDTDGQIKYNPTTYLFSINRDIHFTTSNPSIGNTGNTLNLETYGSARVIIDSNSSSTSKTWTLFHHSDASGNRLAEIYEDGGMSIKGTLTEEAAFDIAENFIKGETMEPGDVVRIAIHSPDTVLLSTGRDGEPVLGVVSEKPGIVLGGIGFGPEDIENGWGAKLYSRFNENRLRLAGEIESVRRALATAETGREEGPSSDSAEENMESRIIERFGEENIVPVALSGRVPVKVDASAESVSVGDYLCAGPTPGTAVNPGPVIGLALEGLEQGTSKIMVFGNTGWYGGISEESDELAFEKEDPEDPDSAVVVEADSPSLLAGDQWMRSGDLFPEWKEPYLAALAAGNVEEATAFRSKLESAFIENYAAVALGGTTMCKADAAFGSIAVADLLTNSPNSGVAMRVEFPAPGTIVAKAMEPLPSGQGMIKVLVMAR